MEFLHSSLTALHRAVHSVNCFGHVVDPASCALERAAPRRKPTGTAVPCLERSRVWLLLTVTVRAYHRAVALTRGEGSSFPMSGVAAWATYLPAQTHALVAVCGSMLDRLRRLEGAVLAVNVSLLVIAPLEQWQKLGLLFASGLTLVVLYAFNDFWDAEADRHNPRKNQALVDLHCRQRGAILFTLAFAATVAVLLALLAVGPTAAAAVVGVMAINVAYSAVLKGVPVVDVGWCALWGGTFAAITLAPVKLLVVVGLMTAVCHVYQTLADREVDAANGVATIAVRSPRLVPVTLAALCTLLAVAFASNGHWVLALTTFTPLLPYFLISSRTVGWLSTKAYFGIVWILLLAELHETP